jgi:hypothetical protein
MSPSTWCDKDHWYSDQNLTEKNNSIPKNEIDDVEIEGTGYTYSIIDSTCFGRMPFLKCHNLNVVIATGVIIGEGGLQFSCANLAADTVFLGPQNITCQHWNINEFCNWDISTLITYPGHKSTFLNQIIFSNLNSGSLDHTYINECYVKSNILNLDHCYFHGTDDITTYISCSSGLLINSQANNNKIYWEGNFWISGTTIDDQSGFNNESKLRGSGQGTFDFTRSTNFAALDGDIKFGHNSKNYGNLYGNPIFSGGSRNYGIIVGDCIFSGENSANYGTISGTSIFVSGALNSGIITQPCIFYSGTNNFGTLKDFSLFYYAYNGGSLNNGSKFICSENMSIGLIPSGDVIFISGINRGNLATSGKISFSSGCQNFGNLTSPSAEISFDFYSNNMDQSEIKTSGFVTFGTGCANLGLIKNGIFNSSSQNYGTISNTGIFKDFSINTGIITTGIFYNLSVNGGKIIDLGQFYGSSTNTYYDITVNTTGIFNDSSINNGFLKNGSFYNNSINNSGSTARIKTSGMFYNSSKNYGSGSNIFFYDNSRNGVSGIVESGRFLSHSINSSGAIIQSLAYFSGNSINCGNIFLSGNCDIVFNENSINSGIINKDLVVLFSGYSSNNNYVKNAEFYNSGQNAVMGTGYKLSFFNESFNKGYIDPTGLFYDKSMNLNNGIIINAIFYDKSSNSSSMRRPLVSGYEFLTSGNRILKITDTAINFGELNNVDVSFSGASINQGTITWKFNPLFIYTSSGIFNTGTTPYSFVATGIFLQNYSGASIPTVNFNEYSTNQANIVGYRDVLFNGTTIIDYSGGVTNYGSISTYPPVPKDSFCVSFINGTNYGPIQNLSIFYKSINYDVLFIAEFDQSINSGTIIDYGSFYKSINYGNVNYGFFQSKSINSGIVNIGNFQQSYNFNRINIGDFYQGSINTLSGIISNSGSFFSNNPPSINYSTIITPIICFSGDSKNMGRVMEAYFSGTAINDVSGNILGHGIFTDKSTNNSNQVSLLDFYDSSANQANSTGIFQFHDRSQNSGILTGQTIFLNDSKIYGECFGKIFLYDSSINSGLLSGTILLQGSGSNPPSNRSLIIGDSDTVLVLAENNGQIVGNSIFTSGINKGFIEKGSFFNSTNDSNGIVSGEGKFYDSANLGNVKTTALFYGSGYNLGSGSVGIFNNQSTNSGTILDGTFYNNSKNASTVYFSRFYNSSYNASNAQSTPFALFYDTSINYGSIDSAYFDNQSTNDFVGIVVDSGTFTNGAINSGQIKGIGVFNNSSINKGSIDGYAIFNGSNCIEGTLKSDALFTNYSFCSNTTIYGSAIFNSGSCYNKNTTIIKGSITKPPDCNP